MNLRMLFLLAVSIGIDMATSDTLPAPVGMEFGRSTALRGFSLKRTSSANSSKSLTGAKGVKMSMLKIKNRQSKIKPSTILDELE